MDFKMKNRGTSAATFKKRNWNCLKISYSWSSLWRLLLMIILVHGIALSNHGYCQAMTL